MLYTGNLLKVYLGKKHNSNKMGMLDMLICLLLVNPLTV